MKKLFFTALVVVSFNGAGFAKSKEVLLKKSVIKEDCYEIATNVLDAYESQYGPLDEGTYHFAFGYVVGRCMSSNKTQNMDIKTFNIGIK